MKRFTTLTPEQIAHNDAVDLLLEDYMTGIFLSDSITWSFQEVLEEEFAISQRLQLVMAASLKSDSRFSPTDIKTILSDFTTDFANTFVADNYADVVLELGQGE